MVAQTVQSQWLEDRVWCLRAEVGCPCQATTAAPRSGQGMAFAHGLSWLLADPWADIWVPLPWKKMGHSQIQALTSTGNLPVIPVGRTEITRRVFLRELGSLDGCNPFCLRLPKHFLPVFPLNLENLFPFFTLSQLRAAGSPSAGREPFNPRQTRPAPFPCSSPISCFYVEHSSPAARIRWDSDFHSGFGTTELIAEGKVPRTCIFQFGVIFVLLAPLYGPAAVPASSWLQLLPFSLLPSLPLPAVHSTHGKLEAKSSNLLRGTCPRKHRIIFPDY